MLTYAFYYLFFILFMLAIALFAIPNSDEDEEDEPAKDKKKTTTPPSSEYSRPIFSPDKNLNEKKGAVGEQVIKVTVLMQLDRTIYHHFKDLIIPNGKGGTSQIDNIIVSPFGIFVVEAKHWQGWIYGKEREAEWTHTLSPRQKYKVRNPLWQNYAHIKALTHLLKLPESQFHSLVVFTHNDCQIKTLLPENVCLKHNFIAHIQKFEREILSLNDVQAACQILSRDEWLATPEKLAKHKAQFAN